MAIPLEYFRYRDVFIDYPFEDVLFRYEHGSRRFFRKFYGESNEKEVPHDNRLLNEAISSGDEIDATNYHTGKAS